MPHGNVSETIPAPCEDVFHLLHDYNRRLEWDTLLQDARLCENWTQAQLHARSVCTGRWYLGGFSLETEYITFDPPNIAAIKMINQPLFFKTFAATIRHRNLENGKSTIEYIFNFTSRPTYLRFLLHPIMKLVFQWETRKRLRSLCKYFSQNSYRNNNSSQEQP